MIPIAFCYGMDFGFEPGSPGDGRYAEQLGLIIPVKYSNYILWFRFTVRQN